MRVDKLALCVNNWFLRLAPLLNTCAFRFYGACHVDSPRGKQANHDGFWICLYSKVWDHIVIIQLLSSHHACRISFSANATSAHWIGDRYWNSSISLAQSPCLLLLRSQSPREIPDLSLTSLGASLLPSFLPFFLVVRVILNIIVFNRYF